MKASFLAGLVSCRVAPSRAVFPRRGHRRGRVSSRVVYLVSTVRSVGGFLFPGVVMRGAPLLRYWTCTTRDHSSPLPQKVPEFPGLDHLWINLWISGSLDCWIAGCRVACARGLHGTGWAQTN